LEFFCALLGIIPGDTIVNNGNSNTPAITFRSRTLKQVSEQALADVPQLPSTASTSYTTVVIPSSTEVRPSSNTEAKEKMAMVSLLSLSEGRNSEQDGRALDIYSQSDEQKETPTYDEVLGAYRKILLSSNFSLEVGASYLFCPSPVQIQSSLFPSRPSITFTENNSSYPSKAVGLETTETQRRTKRLRRAGLDVTNSNDNINENLSKRQKINESTPEEIHRLNLWVPTSSLYPHWSHLQIDHEDNPRKITGLSEIRCVISSIRHVLLS